jgi:sulfur carrier protein
MTALRVLLNGEPAELAPGATVVAALARLGADPTGAGIAVARNGAVVPRGAWAATELRDGDRVEVLGATQGG